MYGIIYNKGIVDKSKTNVRQLLGVIVLLLQTEKG